MSLYDTPPEFDALQELPYRPEDDGPDDEFDEWENAGRYLPRMLYPTLKPSERGGNPE